MLFHLEQGSPPGNREKAQRSRFLLTFRGPGHHTGADCMELSPESDDGGGCPRSLTLWHLRPLTASLPPAEQSPGEGGHWRWQEPGMGSCPPGGRPAACSAQITNCVWAQKCFFFLILIRKQILIRKVIACPQHNLNNHMHMYNFISFSFER